MPYHGLTEQVFFKPGLWAYHGRTEQVFLNPVCETMVWSLTFRVENMFEKKMKKPGLWDRVKNLIEKKWPGLSDNDIVTGEWNFYLVLPSLPLGFKQCLPYRALRLSSLARLIHRSRILPHTHKCLNQAF